MSKKTSVKESQKNLEKLRAAGVTDEVIKSLGDRYSNKEVDRVLGGGNPLVTSVLENTPQFQPVIPTFEEFYNANPGLGQEDQAQAKALFEPYYQLQISDIMEDLNAWVTNEKTDYDRTLRRGRASLAAQGGAIGGERQTFEKETTNDYQSNMQNKVRETERQVGSEAIGKAGINPIYSDREGDIVGNMKSSIEEQALWYKDQRQQRYNMDTSNYYKQQGTTNWYGKQL